MTHGMDWTVSTIISQLFVYWTTELAMFSQRSNELNYVWFNVILFPYCSWVYVFQNFNQIIFVTNLVIKYFFHDFKAVFKLKNFKAFFAIKRSLVWLYSISFYKSTGKKRLQQTLELLIVLTILTSILLCKTRHTTKNQFFKNIRSHYKAILPSFQSAKS